MRDQNETPKAGRSTWERPAMRRLDAADAEMTMGTLTDKTMTMNTMTGIS